MVIQRQIYLHIAFGFVPDLLIAWGASYYFNTGLFGFVLALVGLQCVYAALWLKSSLWSWFFYWLSGRRMMTANIQDFLAKNNFPAPPEFLAGTEEYFSQIAQDQTVDRELRLKAAIEYGSFQGLRYAGRYQLTFQLHMATKDALTAHARAFDRTPNSNP